MAKKRDSLYEYRMRLAVSKGFRYAVTRKLYVDPKDSKEKATSVSWGTVDESLVFHPNNSFRLLSQVEKDKFIYPDDWNLSIVNGMKDSVAQDELDIVGVCDSTMLYGDIWLLNQIADTIGIIKDLRKVFNGNEAYVQDVLTLAYHMFLTKNSMNRVAHWQRIEKLPTPKEHILSSRYITEFTQRIGEESRSRLIRLRTAKLHDEDLLCIDSTTRSAYGKRLCDIRFSKTNKDDPQLACTTEVVVYSMDTHMPVYYRTFQGNMIDIRTVEIVLQELRDLGIQNKVIAVTDRGYYSTQEIEWCISHHQSLITMAKCRSALVKKHIEKLGPIDGVPVGMELNAAERLYYIQYEEKYDVKDDEGNVIPADRLRVNLYFNPKFRPDDIMDIDIEIQEQQKDLVDMVTSERKLSEEERKKYRYFIIECDEHDTVVSFQYNEKKIKNAKMMAGFFAIVTHGVNLDPIPALNIYRMRGEQELCFEIGKDELNQDKQNNWSEDGKAGRRFIWFVGMCIISYARSQWRNIPELYDTFDSTEQIFDEMRSIKWIEHPGVKVKMTPFIKNQITIAEKFGYTIPAECLPTYKTKKVRQSKKSPDC